MLRAYGPDCDGSLVDAKARDAFPTTATWIDLEEPTKEEEALVERCIHVNVPTQDEMAEIEPSSRLYEQNGALYMTVSVLYGVEDGSPTTTPIGFVLADNRLVTVRYATPKPVRAFATMRGASPSWSAMPRPRWSGCSTRSSTGWPTRSRMSAARSRRFRSRSSSSKTTSAESRPSG